METTRQNHESSLFGKITMISYLNFRCTNSSNSSASLWPKQLKTSILSICCNSNSFPESWIMINRPNNTQSH